MDHDTDFQYQTLQDDGNIGMAVMHIKPEYFYTKYEVKVQVRFSDSVNLNYYFFLLLMFCP